VAGVNNLSGEGSYIEYINGTYYPFRLHIPFGNSNLRRNQWLYMVC